VQNDTTELKKIDLAVAVYLADNDSLAARLTEIGVIIHKNQPGLTAADSPKKSPAGV